MPQRPPSAEQEGPRNLPPCRVRTEAQRAGCSRLLLSTTQGRPHKLDCKLRMCVISRVRQNNYFMWVSAPPSRVLPPLHPPLPRLCLLPSGPLPKTPSPRTPEAKPSSRGVFTSHCTHSCPVSVCRPPSQTLMSRVLGHVRIHLRPWNQAHKDCSIMEICIFFKIHPQPSPSKSQGKQHTKKELLHNQPPRLRDISPS